MKKRTLNSQTGHSALWMLDNWGDSRN